MNLYKETLKNKWYKTLKDFNDYSKKVTSYRCAFCDYYDNNCYKCDIDPSICNELEENCLWEDYIIAMRNYEKSIENMIKALEDHAKD